jgi:hypothetical protein
LSISIAPSPYQVGESPLQTVIGRQEQQPRLGAEPAGTQCERANPAAISGPQALTAAGVTTVGLILPSSPKNGIGPAAAMSSRNRPPRVVDPVKLQALTRRSAY